VTLVGLLWAMIVSVGLRQYALGNTYRAIEVFVFTGTAAILGLVVWYVGVV
jgi:hypothetical protein